MCMATDFFLAARFSFLSRDRGYTEHLLSSPLEERQEERLEKHFQKNRKVYKRHRTLTHKLQHNQKERRRRPSPRYTASLQRVPDKHQRKMRNKQINQIMSYIKMLNTKISPTHLVSGKSIPHNHFSILHPEIRH